MELTNMTDSGSYPAELNYFNISLSNKQLDNLFNLLNSSLADVCKRKEYLIKNNKPCDFLSHKALDIRELLYEVDSARSLLNKRRADYICQSLDNGVFFHE